MQAEQAGLKSLGRTIDMLGPYQAAGAFMLRTFADRNKDTVDRYLAAYVEALRFVRDPANRTDSVAILVDKLKLSAKEAERTYELLMDPDYQVQDGMHVVAYPATWFVDADGEIVAQTLSLDAAELRRNVEALLS